MFLQRLFHVLASLTLSFRTIHGIHGRTPLGRYEAGRVEIAPEGSQATHGGVGTSQNGFGPIRWESPLANNLPPFANNLFAHSAKNAYIQNPRQNETISETPFETVRMMQYLGQISKTMGLPETAPPAKFKTLLGDGSLAGTRAALKRHFDGMPKSDALAAIINYADSVIDPAGGKKLRHSDPYSVLPDIKRLGYGFGASKIVDELDALIKNGGLAQMSQMLMMFYRLMARSGLPAASMEFIHKLHRMYRNSNRPGSEELRNLVNETNARLGITQATFSDPKQRQAVMDNPFAMDDMGGIYTISRPTVIVEFDFPCNIVEGLGLKLSIFAEGVIRGPGAYDTVMGPGDGIGRLDGVVALWFMIDGLRFAFVNYGIGGLKVGTEIRLMPEHENTIVDEVQISARIRLRSSVLPLAKESTITEVPKRKLTVQPMLFVESNTLQTQPLAGIEIFAYKRIGNVQLAIYYDPLVDRTYPDPDKYSRAPVEDILEIFPQHVWTGHYLLISPYQLPVIQSPPLPPLPPLPSQQEPNVPHVITELPPEWAGVFDDPPSASPSEQLQEPALGNGIPTNDRDVVSAMAKGLQSPSIPIVARS